MKQCAKVKKKYSLFTGKQLLWLILPIVIEQIFSTSLGLFDSMMVSGIDTDGSSGLAVSNVDYVNNLIIQLFSAFATGGAIITSQYLGAGDGEKDGLPEQSAPVVERDQFLCRRFQRGVQLPH